MRVFELARALKKTSGEVLRQAQALDLEAHSTLSRLDDDDVAQLRKFYDGHPARAGEGPGIAAQARLAAKRERITKALDAKAADERKALDGAIGRARAINDAVKRTAPSKSRAVTPPVHEPQKTDSAKPAREPEVQTTAAPAAAEAKAPEAPAATVATPAAPAAPAPTPAAPAAKEPAAETAVDRDTPVATGDIKIEPLPPPGDDEAKVIIHADTADLEIDAKDAAGDAVVSLLVPEDDDIDADEELASAYLGRRAQTPPPAKVHAMRPKEARDADMPRPPSGKSSRAGVKAVPGKTAPARAADTPPAAPRQKAAAAGRTATAPAPAGKAAPRERGAQAKGRGAAGTAQSPYGRILRGHQPIIRGQQNDTDQTAAVSSIPSPIKRGTAAGAPSPKQRFAPVMPAAPSGDKTLTLRGPVLVKELAEMMSIRPNRLIADLMQLNVLVSINQRVDIEKADQIAKKYGYTVELERTRRSAARKPAIRRLDAEDDIPDDSPEDMVPRPPVVTFLGHVDHGKTSLMDRIRQAHVVSGEAGGITQHIGAYSVELTGRKITFLDTPGHAAFSAMRARGANLTDIAVIIIAADDGIMPQTKEVIKQAQQAGVQMMVAINKCDLPAAKPDRVRQQLQAEGLTPEEWGGDMVVCEVSAATGQGVDHLLEMILLQADMLELQANPNRRADGYVIEAQLEMGLGPTATLLVASGTLKSGNVVLIGEHFGRLRGLMDDRGRKVLSAGPAMAVRVMGLSGVPEPGAEFRVMVNEKRARELAEQFARERKESELAAANRPPITMDALLDTLKTQKKKELSVVVKGDTQGSVEAIVDSLRDIHSEKISLDIMSTGIGNITTNDVQRAAAGNAVLLGFQVGLDTGVAALARHDDVKTRTFRIIYELLDFVKQTMIDMLDPEYREVVKGHAQIRAIFDIGKKGRIAGCQLLDGIINVGHRVRVKRARDIVFDGRIASLRHFQDEVEEVRDLQECGIFFDNFQSFAEGDIVECYAMEELPRDL